MCRSASSLSLSLVFEKLWTNVECSNYWKLHLRVIVNILLILFKMTGSSFRTTKKIMCSLPNTLHSKNYCVLTAVLVLDRWSETPCTLAGYVTLPNNKNRFFNPYRDHKSRRRAIYNMFNAFIPFVQTSTTAKMIHVCIAEPALIDSIVLTAVVRLDLMALAAKMYQVRLTQLFNKYRGKTMEQLQRFHA